MACHWSTFLALNSYLLKDMGGGMGMFGEEEGGGGGGGGGY